MGDWRQRIRDEITSLSREAAEKRQCLVPMIAQLPMPDEESEVKSEVAAMYEALSHRDSAGIYLSQIIYFVKRLLSTSIGLVWPGRQLANFGWLLSFIIVAMLQTASPVARSGLPLGRGLGGDEDAEHQGRGLPGLCWPFCDPPVAVGCSQPLVPWPYFPA